MTFAVVVDVTFGLVSVDFVSTEVTAGVSFTAVVCIVVSAALVVDVVTAALIVVLVMDEADDGEALQLVMPPIDKNAIKRTTIQIDF